MPLRVCIRIGQDVFTVQDVIDSTGAPRPQAPDVGHQDSHCEPVGGGPTSSGVIRVSGIASLSHDVLRARTSASCWGHKSATRDIAPCEICQAEAPRFVHGVCQVVVDITSEHAIFRPAAHMPVNS